MIIVKLMGGLGNQMFQYAAAKRLALAKHTTFKLDTSFLLDRTLRENFTFRNYALDIFVLEAGIATRKEIDKFILQPVSSRKTDKLLNFLDPHSYYSENQFNFESEVLELPKNTYLIGYFQSEKYFIDYQYQIRKEFKFRGIPNEANLRLINEISKNNSVAVHIRLGDYVSNTVTHQFHGVCPNNYYLEGLEYLKSKLVDPVLYIFSDDIEWVKQNFNCSLPLTYVEVNKNENGKNDLRLMTYCKHHLIANSSFSWWGAWLAKWAGQIVIAPKHWFSSTASMYNKKILTHDLYLENWVKL